MTLEEEITEKLINNKSFKKNNNFYWGALYKNPFSWKYYSSAVLEYCPEYFDTNKYNWKKDTWAVVHYYPELLDLNKANIENIFEWFPKYKGMSLKEIKEKAILNKL